MKIHCIWLRHFRGVDEQQVEFATDGVSVVEGANELGKTSMVEAIDLLLTEYDSSQKKAVKSVQPVHVDAGAEVEAEFSAGLYRFVYRKRWHKHPETTLRIIHPFPEQLTGRRAHDRVREILGETIDEDLWAALRVEQRNPISQVALGGDNALIRALDAASGGAHDTGRESNLYERIERAYRQYFTATGKPAGEHRALDEEYARAQCDVETAEHAVAEVERDTDRHAELARELDNLATRQHDHERELAALEQCWQGLERQRLEIDRLQQRAEGLAASATAARLRHGHRQQLIADAEAKTALLNALHDDAERAEPARQAIQGLVDAARADLAEAQHALTAREEQARRAADELVYLRDVARLEELTDLQQRAEAAMRAIDQAERFLATCVVDDTLVADLDDARLAVERHRAALEAGAPRLTVEALSSHDILLNGEPLRLGLTGIQQRSVTEAMEIEAPDVLRVRVTPGGDEHTLVTAVHDAERVYRELCAHAAVEDLAQAREVLRQRQENQRDRDEARDALSRALGDRSLEEIRQDHTRLSARVAAGARGDHADRINLADAEAAEQAAQQAVVEARERVEQARETADQHRDQIHTFDAQALGRAAAIESAQCELDAVQNRLTEARSAASDDDLAQSLAQADRDAAAHGENLRQQRARFLEHDPESVQAQLTNAREVRHRLTEAHTRCGNELRALAVKLDLAGSEGRYDRLAAARATLEQVERRHRSVRAAASAAALLFTTISRHREQTKRAYVAPFRAEVERLARIVFGPSLRLDIDGDLCIVSRTLDGVTVPYDDLSTGAREQLCILTRLACAALTDPNDGVPVIIDDALGHSDPQRLARIGAAFTSASNHAQVIILTCTPDRYRSIGAARSIPLVRNGEHPVSTIRPVVIPSPAETAATTAHASASAATDQAAHPEDVILACLRAAGRALSKADVLDRTGLPSPLWTPTIRALTRDGKVVQLGQKRGATYLPTDSKVRR
jgi:hypothetical protein